jgi:hypothetical protein
MLIYCGCSLSWRKIIVVCRCLLFFFMTPITFNMLPMTLAEFKALNWAHLRKARKRLLVAPLLGIAIVAVNLSLDAKYKAQSIGLFTGLAIIAGIFLLYGALIFSINKSIKKSYLNTPALADGMTITLSENSISMHSHSINGEQPWPVSYKLAIKIKNWVIMSSGPASAYFLDTEQIAAPAMITDLEALFQRKEVKLTR